MKNKFRSSGSLILKGRWALFAILAVALSLAVQVSAGVPSRINFQGKLSDTGNNPRTGSYDFTFRIFDVPTGGSALWTESQTGVTVANGLFSVQLGSYTAIPVSVLNGATTYLEVQVGAEVGTPRERLAAVPYALRAAEADSLSGGVIMTSAAVSGSGFSGTESVFLVGGGSFTVLANGNVGIGTMTPVAKFTMVGSQARFESNGATEGGEIQLSGPTNFPDDDFVIDNYSGRLRFIRSNPSGAEVATVLQNGNFGIGAGAAPLGTLHVKGDYPLYLEGLAGDTADKRIYRFDAYTDYLVLQAMNDANAWVRDLATFKHDGNVGIGTTSPGAKLDVSGNIRLSQAWPEIEFNNGGGRIGSANLGNTLAFYTGGGFGSSANERMRINSSGYVGIGVDAGNPLEVRQDTAASWMVKTRANSVDNSAGIWQDGSKNTQLALRNGAGTLTTVVDTGGNTYFNGAGNVGVGTASPNNKFHVAGNALVTSSAAVSGSGLSGTSPVFQVVGGTFTVLANGNVGVGTGSPSDRLHIYGGAGYAALKIDAAVGNSRDIIWSSNGSARWALRTDNSAESGGDAGSDFQFVSRTDAGAYKSAVLAFSRSNGNVGIATTTPSYRLHVSSGAGEAGTVMAVSTGVTNVFWVAGDGAHATKFYGDGSALTGIPGGADNLGNHTATTQLNMGGYVIYSSSDVTAARYQIAGSTVLALLPGTGNIGVGVGAGNVTSGGSGNSFFGYVAGYNNGWSNNNSLFGYAAGYDNSAGSGNSFVGAAAGRYNTTGSSNTVVGVSALYYNRSGSANAVIGDLAAGIGSGGANSFSSATVVGYQAGYNLSTGSDNTFLGWQSGYNVTTGAGNIVIGYDQKTSAPGANNELNIGGVLYGALDAKTIGISTRVPYAALDIVSTGTAANVYAQIWRDSTGLVVASMTATGVLYPQTSGVGGSDNLGNHTATTLLNMAGFQVKNVSSMTIIAPDTIASSLWVSTSATVPHLYVSTSGRVGIATALPVAALQVGGQIGGNRPMVSIFADASSGGTPLRVQAATVSADIFAGHDYTGMTKFIVAGNGTVGISTGIPSAALDIVSTGTAVDQMTQIWRASDGVIKASMSATGVMMAARFVGDGSGLTNLSGGSDNLGNHTATTQLSMGNYAIYSSSSVTAARYQINGSTVLAILPGVGSLGVGINAGRVNTGTYNLFVGSSAGNFTTSGSYNAFVGQRSAYSNTTGQYNAFLGYTAGYSNTTGESNSFLGNQAGYSNTAGSNNSFLGSYAAYYNTTGQNNVAVGYASAQNNQRGSANTVLGSGAGQGSGTNSFSSSTLVGYMAGSGLTTGSDNIFLGWLAGHMVTTGSGNIVIGYNNDVSAPTASNELNIGDVLYGNLSAKTIGISTRAPQAALDVVSTGTASGVYAQLWRNNSGTVKAYVNSLGDVSAASYRIAGSTVLAMLNSAGVAIGPGAGRSNTTGDQNNFFGAGAGASNTSGSSNNFWGADAGYANTTGSNNTFIGSNSGVENVSGGNNNFVGLNSGLSNTTGSGNNFFGVSAGYYNQTGSANSVLGNEAGGAGGAGVNSFSSSTLMGYQAGRALTTGGDNILIGFQSGYAVTTGTGNIVIGYAKDTSAPDASNELNIGGVIYGDLAAGNVGIGAVSPGQKLEVAGGVRLNTAAAKPACDAAARGTIWFTQGGAGVKDAFEVCAKDAGDAYAWRLLY